MSPRSEFSRLSRTLDCTRQRFCDIALDSLTKEIDKELLVSLTQLLRRVKQWTHLFDSGSTFDKEEELPVDSTDIRECFDPVTSNLDDLHCLANIIGHLVFLLAINNPYSQHLVGSILLAVSEFVIASGCGWNTFMNLLCICLELNIWKTLSSSPKLGAVSKCYSLNGLPILNELSKLRPESANWYVVAAIVRVFHSIMKDQNQEHDGEIMKIYLDSVSSLFLNVPWDLLFDVNYDVNAEALRDSDKDVSIQTRVACSTEVAIFCCSFLQFLCSLVDQSSYAKDGVGSFADIFRVINLVPSLVDFCHAHLRNSGHFSLFQYSRHKILVLMIKLSSQMHPEHADLVSWIHLTRKYFDALLLQPISGGEIDKNVSLEDSPFCINIPNQREQYTISGHLQRLTVFLFLRLSLNLACFEDQQYASENLNHSLTLDMNLCSVHCIKCKGLSELQKFLQAHVPDDTAISEFYFHQCWRFTLSFLQLFMHEDDILFKMLLQLFCVPFYSKHHLRSEAPFAVTNHQFFLLSDLFNPVHLFHLFLAEILYDHQVLLDYLISKDLGPSCAEYLLRALRLICNAWKVFYEFPGVKDVSGQSPLKRQKVLVNNLDFKKRTSFANVDAGIASGRLPFVAAKDCLISLRKSIESLSRKNIFPYNPQALLRRLMQFERLSAQHQLP